MRPWKIHRQTRWWQGSILCLTLCDGQGALAARADHTPATQGQDQLPQIPVIALPPASHSSTTTADDHPDASHDIIVTADHRGEARVAAESSLDATEIAAYGSDDIASLLQRLRGIMGLRDDEEPVILINGRAVGFDQSILSYPPEALSRLAILRPEAAAQYGERAGRRVVNLVLQRQFARSTASLGLTLPTAGGRHSENAAIGHVAIHGDTRWNLQLRYAQDSKLYARARRAPVGDGDIESALFGDYVFGLGDSTLDPALDRLTGAPIHFATIPRSAATGSVAPPLSDFLENAQGRNPRNRDDFETLMPSRQNFNLSGGVTRPLGGFTASLSLTANVNATQGLRGLPMVTATLPATSLWSPFANDVGLMRVINGEPALRNSSTARSLGMIFTLNGLVLGWQSNLSLNYGYSRSRNLFETGMDATSIGAAIAAGDATLNPFGALPPAARLATHNRQQGHMLNARLSATRSIITLPAGPVTLSLLATGAWNWARNDGNSTPALGWLARQQSLGQVSLNLPLSRRDEAPLPLLGELSLTLTASGQTMSLSRAQTRWGGDVNWSPLPLLRLRGSFETMRTAPSFDQLDAPLISTITRIFDYTRQETAEVAWQVGGNPTLRGGNRESLSVTAQLRPLDTQALTLNFGYRQLTTRAGIMSFPELTPAIEAAYPNRVSRNAAGRLLAVDARAINIDHSAEAEWTSGFALRLPLPDGADARPTPQTSLPSQWTLSVTHQWRRKNILVTHPGLPVIDQLRDGGLSRHALSAQFTVGRRDIGASLNAMWSSPAWVRSGGGTADFRTEPPLLINAAFFIAPQRIAAGQQRSTWFSNVKLSLDIQNLLNRHRRVRFANGATPPGYGRGEIDPLGRTIRVTLQKRI